MAVGMPLLATATFGPSEMLRNGVEGRLIPAENVGAMAEAMLSMLSDPAALSKMGAAAYARAADWLSPQRIATESVEVYRAAIAIMKR